MLKNDVFLGGTFALAAGLMWGLVFVAPVFLHDYSAFEIAFGRYLLFGVISLFLISLDFRQLKNLSTIDWINALTLSMIGNILYYLLLSSAVQRAGSPLPSVVIGTLPVVIAIASNALAHKGGSGHGSVIPWGRLAPSLICITIGLGLVNHSEVATLKSSENFDAFSYVLGFALAIGAVACWTWYPLMNARWLKGHPEIGARAWTTAQGLSTLPAAFIGFWIATGPSSFSYSALLHSLGPRPITFIAVVCALALLSSWVATICWNKASRYLPTSIAGQLIVFETIAALVYSFMLRGSMPSAISIIGGSLLVVGVVIALRVFSKHQSSR